VLVTAARTTPALVLLSAQYLKDRLPTGDCPACQSPSGRAAPSPQRQRRFLAPARPFKALPFSAIADTDVLGQ
jgi:hypothetical protein